MDNDYKICSQCKEKKPIEKMSVYQVYWCIECARIYNKKYRIEHKEKIKKLLAKWYKKNKTEVKKHSQKYYYEHIEDRRKWENENNNKYPWLSHLYNARRRCNDKSNLAYGGRGIMCFLIKEEIKTLWFRDKAYLMDKPSIDRKDSDGNYTFENCRFIEMRDNIRGKGRK